MTTQNNQRRQYFLLAAMAAIFLLGAFDSTFAQGRLGKKYGTRDPRVCANAAKTGRTISATEAVASVICNAEHEIGNESLFLVEDVKVTFIGKGQRPNPNAASYPTMPDLDSLEYPIRGSYKKYECGVPDLSPPGKNCRLYNEANAKGECYKDTFGQWHCGMTDETVGVDDYEEVAPPGGAVNQTTNAPTAKKPAAANNQPKTDKQTVEKTAEAVGGKDDDALPTPDFSEMEKYFDISKIEYSAADRKLYFIGRMTKKINANDWQINFYDEDGIKVISTNGITPISGDYENVGDVAKYFFYLPPESKWKSVKKVVINRNIN